MTEHFETFHKVRDQKLRAFNRLVTTFNIKADFGSVAAEKYLANFDDKDRIQMLAVSMLVADIGADEFKRTLNAEPELSDDQVVMA